MDLFARRNYLNGSEFGGTQHIGTIARTSVAMQRWCECLNHSLPELKKLRIAIRLQHLMAQINGWERTTNIKRLPIYGRQRLYQKTT